MKSIILTFVAGLFSSSLALAGANTADIQCASKDKSFEMAGYFPGGIAEFDVKVSAKDFFEGRLYSVARGGRELEENASIEMFDASGDGVLAYNLKNKVRGTVSDPSVTISMHALPQSVKKVWDRKNERSVVKYAAAIRVFIFPNLMQSSSTKSYRANCVETARVF